VLSHDHIGTDNADATRIVVGVPDDAGDDGAPTGSRSRACDRLARDVLPRRGSTVFPAPSRQAVRALADGAARAAASDVDRRVTGTGLSAGAASLAPALAAVDDPPRDARGLPMQTVYRRAAPFDAVPQ